MRPIKSQRFNAFAAYCRTPLTLTMAEEVNFYEADNTNILATIIKDREDSDYSGIILARDEKKRYRWISCTKFFKSKTKARIALKDKIAEIIPNLEKQRLQGDNDAKPVDFFTPLKKTKQPLHKYFLYLTQLEGYSPAKEIIEPMMRWFEDADGNFVEQFQTTGFDSRIWELYLFSLFTEIGYAIDKTSAIPDFCCTGLGRSFCAEATTVNPSRDKNGNIVDPPTISTDAEYTEATNNYYPIKFAGPLTEKLGKRYWEKENVKGKPFIIAIQDFHTPIAMTLSRDALPIYLYGFREGADFTNEKPTYEKVKTHQWGTKVINSNFFSFEGAENISAVIFNGSATMSKFNRIGLQAGFGSGNTTLIRSGIALERANNTVNPVDYQYIVSDNYRIETWAEGLEVFHNPRATHPLPMDTFINAAHHRVTDSGGVESMMPSWHPMQSFTKVAVKEPENKSNHSDAPILDNTSK